MFIANVEANMYQWQHIAATIAHLRTTSAQAGEVRWVSQAATAFTHQLQDVQGDLRTLEHLAQEVIGCYRAHISALRDAEHLLAVG